ncbi:ATP-sensitive inward rectifier potassium, partial [Gryllus bimaculatus]
MCLQSITGVMIQAFMVGIVFAKLSRPKKRTQTLLFSRNAVVCLRDGSLCLMFRVGDMRKSHIVEAHVRAQLIRQKVTAEGELLPYFQQELRVGGDGDEERIFFIWPTTIVHCIDRQSPLYNMTAAELARERLEVVVILEGVIESTGMTTQARSSYLPSEILWGHRFETLVTFKKETGEYEVDYGVFNSTYEVATPLCSARELDERRARLSGEAAPQAAHAPPRSAPPHPAACAADPRTSRP